MKIKIFYIEFFLGFAPELFTTNPTSATSNQVTLTNELSSYDCKIHPDKTTTTQITCYTP